MPTTITAYTTFVPSTKIESGQVNANFLNHRGTVLPIHESTATAQDATYDVGSSDYRFVNLYGNPVISVASKSADYSLTSSDYFLTFDVSGGTSTAYLPSASGLTGKPFVLKKTDSGFNQVVVEGSGSETIDSTTTVHLSTQNEALYLVSDGTNWEILERRIPSSWNSYTPVLTSTGTAPGTGSSPTESGFWKREGDSVLLSIYIAPGGSGISAGTGDYQLTLPSGLTIDSAKYGSSQNHGVMNIFNNSGSTVLYPVEASSNSIKALTPSGTARIGQNTPSTGWFQDSSRNIKAWAKLPITGWEG